MAKSGRVTERIGRANSACKRNDLHARSGEVRVYHSMNTNTHRIATYARVSTDGQSVTSQGLELKEYAKTRNWTIAREYTDKASGGAGSSRSGLDTLMKDVRKGRINLILCVKLDRLGRSFPHMAQLIGELDAAG